MGEKPNTSCHSPAISDSRLELASFISCACIVRLETIAPPALSPHLPTETLAGMARPRALLRFMTERKFHCIGPIFHFDESLQRVMLHNRFALLVLCTPRHFAIHKTGSNGNHITHGVAA